VATGQPAATSLDASAARLFADFQLFGPQRAFVVSADGRGFWWAGSNGADPGRAIESALKACQDKTGGKCTVFAVNDILLNGREWKAATPPASPPIGRLRGQPWWENKGPQAAAGVIVWSHGYRSGSDSTSSAPQPWIGRFAASGYDLYRFDREWIRTARATRRSLSRRFARPGPWAIAASCWPVSRPARGCHSLQRCAAHQSMA
jgi:hypothetical protein